MDRNEAIKEVRSFIGQLTEGCQEAILALVPELAEIEAGKYKVVTRDGRDVRILCWDANQFYPICAQFRLCAGTLIARYFDCNGIFEGSDETENGYDLFLIPPEPELSEFEKALKDCVNMREPEVPMTDEGARNNATILLALARKELEKELPRWVKVNEGVMLDKYSKYLLRSNEGCYYYCCGTTITRDGYMLLVDNLEKLPKEDEK